jgi:hypothetical protein
LLEEFNIGGEFLQKQLLLLLDVAMFFDFFHTSNWQYHIVQSGDWQWRTAEFLKRADTRPNDTH